MYLLVFLAIQLSSVDQPASFYISMERSGGFAGMTVHTEVQSDTLSSEQQKELWSLIAQTDQLSLPKSSDGGNPMPDQYTYKLSLRFDAIEKNVEISEGQLTDSWRSLINHLMRLTRKQ